MNIIIPQAKIVEMMVGKQSISEVTEYRLLKFCFYQKYEKALLLYNNLTKEFLELSPAESEIVLSNYFDTADEFVRKLIEKWFLVPIAHDDFKLSDQIVNLTRTLSTDRSVTTYNILPTTACNARCFYCFEAGTRVSTMDEKTAEAVGNYIVRHAGGKTVSIQWFGGEPLCNIQAIDIICNKLRDAKVEFVSRIITNGYLFDEELINRAKNDWQLRLVQITLDGLQDTYNRAKNYKHNDPNPYARVMDNIGKILDADIRAHIRLNMDSYNTVELNKLVDELYARFAHYKKMTIHSNLIYEDVGFVPTSRTDDERAILQEQYFDLCEHVNRLGFTRTLPLKNEIRTNRCMADSYNATQITPEGNLGNCEHYPVDDYYGNVFNDDVVQPWNDYISATELCNDCAIYPSCYILSRCNTNKCGVFRKKRQYDDLLKSMIYTYKLYLSKKEDRK